MKLIFKEKTSKMQLFEVMFVPAIGTGLFMWVAFSNGDRWLWLFTVGVCVVVWLFVFWHFKRLSSVIELTDYAIKVTDRWYFKETLEKTRVQIINKRLWIPYEEVLDITVEEGDIYLNFLGISSSIVLHPADIEAFLSALNKKVSIDIKYSNPVKK